MRRIEKQRMFEKFQNETGVSTEEYYIAYKRVKRIKGFYTHLIVYVLVNLFLIFDQRLDRNSMDHFFHWHTYSTAFFWGLGLLAHGISVFGKDFFFGNDWEERKIKEYMATEKAKEQNWK
ncbi:2TM domain-containing protein [Flavobacterium sp.]|uniref:2TM domain-containing protein n=1 Tax=Flavobacterium sp. TaxID=239 RepID=UPI0037508FBD